jgi:hypothetical protein
MKLFSSSCAVVALFASAASADVVITLTNFGAYGNQFAEAITPGRLSGTLVGATIDVDRTQSTWFTRANDLRSTSMPRRSATTACSSSAEAPTTRQRSDTRGPTAAGSSPPRPRDA